VSDGGKDENGEYTIKLDEYERDNLLALLHMIYRGDGRGPLSCLSTGDWAGQIYWKLDPKGFDETRHAPNVSIKEQLRRFK
jgi:hypothetical protein